MTYVFAVNFECKSQTELDHLLVPILFQSMSLNANTQGHPTTVSS